MRHVEQIEIGDLLAGRPSPFVRHHLASAPLKRAWRRGTALVVESGPRPGGRFTASRQYAALGVAADLDPLLSELADTEPAPGRLTLEDVGARSPWPHQVAGHWIWMWSGRPPPAPSEPVVEVTDRKVIDALLDVGNPTSWARPDDDTVEAWLGVEREGQLVAVGSLTRRSTGAGHLQGVTVHPTYRRSGLGTAVSAALTLRAQAGGSCVATLGVYAANEAAVATYLRLGYAAPHTFLSGPVSRRAD